MSRCFYPKVDNKKKVKLKTRFRTAVKRLAEIHETFKEHVRSRREGRLKAEEKDLFSGAFWTGRRAMEMGLIDGIGDLHTVMRERFDKKYRLKDVEPKKSFFRGRLGLSAFRSDYDTGFTAAIAAFEERIMWNRFDL